MRGSEPTEWDGPRGGERLAERNCAQVCVTLLRLICCAVAVAGGVAGAAFAQSLVPPDAVRAAPLSASAIELTWIDRAEGEDGYRIERRSGWNGAWELVAVLPPNSFTYLHGGLAGGTDLFFRVSASAGATLASGDLARATTDDRPFGERTLRFQNGVNSYAGTIDLGLSQATPQVSDTSPYVWVVFGATGQTSTSEAQALVRFADIFGARRDQVPADALISRAVLRIYLPTHASVHSNNRIFFHQMLVGWSAGATWNSSAWGGNGVQPNGVEAKTEPVAQRVFNQRGLYYDVDVTDTLRAWRDGEPNHGWLLRSRLTDNYGYSTSHAPTIAARPELLVTFDADPGNRAPQVTVAGPADGAADVPEPAPLAIEASDPDGQPLEVSFHGRPRATAQEDFTIVVLPDTQYYVSSKHGGTPAMVNAQMDWIVSNRLTWNIPFVLHVGDLAETGDAHETEWTHISNAFARLENPQATGLAGGIPFAVCVGNHDQSPNGDPHGTTTLFNKYFGLSRFASKPTYGGYYGANNDNHYQLFSAGQSQFIVISLEYGRPSVDSAVLAWASGLLANHPERKAIILAHHTMNPGEQGAFSADGTAIYNALRHHPNLMLFLGGHITGEGWRVDRFNGHTVYSLVQDFQYDANGGDGWLRLLTFSPRRNEIQVRTYSPWLDAWRRDYASEFTLPYDFGTEIADFAELGRHAGSDGRVTQPWWGLVPGRDYEWFAVVSDGRKTVRTAERFLRAGESAYEVWRHFHFAPEDPRGAPSIDADGDGLTNLLEFHLGGNPFDGRSAPGAPEIVAVDGLLFGRYVRREGTGRLFAHDFSADLRDWTRRDAEWARGVEVVEPIGAGSGRERVTLPLGPAVPAVFWRLVLSE